MVNKGKFFSGFLIIYLRRLTVLLTNCYIRHFISLKYKRWFIVIYQKTENKDELVTKILERFYAWCSARICFKTFFVRHFFEWPIFQHEGNWSHRPANTTDEVIQSPELNKEKYIGKYVLLTQTIVIAPSFGCFIAVLQIIHSMRSNIRRQNVRRRKICFST